MGKRQPTAGQREMYAAKKDDTLKRIKKAIHEMKEWDEPVTRSEIMKRAGVASGTLSQPYVKELLKEERVCQYASIPVHDKVKDDYEKEQAFLIKENKSLKSRIDKQDERLDVMKKMNDKLTKELRENKEVNARLRGQVQMLLERLDSAGLSTGAIKRIK